VTTNRVEELVHIIWADKIERLAATILDANSLLVNTICKSMPKVLQKVMGSGHMTWVSFCSVAHAAMVTQITEAKEEEKEAQDLREQVRRLQDLRETSAWDIMNSLQQLTINTPSPIPCFPILQMQPPNTPNYPPAPTFNTNNQPSAHAAHQAPNQPAHRQNRTPAEHMNDVIRLVLPIHLNTPASWASYNTQIIRWNTEYAGQQVSETHPYPLSPGTMPVSSGECWRCGMPEHMGPSCDSSTQIPGLEGRWRSIAASIKRSCPLTTTRNVNFVNETSTWTSREEYDQQVIANYLASQGKEQGSSA
jgi:hypothetical protein